MTKTSSAWHITYDAVEDDERMKGRLFVRRGEGEPTRSVRRADLTIEFRLYDDDDNLYYKGRASDYEAVEAAHDWAQGNAGVTRSQIKEAGGKWESFIG